MITVNSQTSSQTQCLILYSQCLLLSICYQGYSQRNVEHSCSKLFLFYFFSHSFCNTLILSTGNIKNFYIFIRADCKSLINTLMDLFKYVFVPNSVCDCSHSLSLALPAGLFPLSCWLDIFIMRRRYNTLMCLCLEFLAAENRETSIFLELHPLTTGFYTA